MPCWSKSSAVQVKELAVLKAVRTMSLFDTERVILTLVFWRVELTCDIAMRLRSTSKVIESSQGYVHVRILVMPADGKRFALMEREVLREIYKLELLGKSRCTDDSCWYQQTVQFHNFLCNFNVALEF